MNKISLKKIEANNIDFFQNSISNTLDLISYTFQNKIKNVVIKPNLCYYWDYTTGQTTDPKFVFALTKLLYHRISPKINISIIESDASAMRCKHAFKFLNYERLFNDSNINLINLSPKDYIEKTVMVKNNEYNIKIPLIIDEADLKINIPKIKYMIGDIKFTCALKNIFGCIPERNKFKYHSKIHEIIVAVNKLMNFDLTIVDGNYVSGTSPKRLGLVMSSTDPVAIDTAASKIAGLNPSKINYIKLAQEEQVGSMAYNLLGEPLEQFTNMYPKNNVVNGTLNKGYELLLKSPLGKRIYI